MDGHNNEAPPARRKPPNRTTERLELKLQPADAAAIRIAAELLDMTISGYVARLVSVAGDPMKIARERNRHGDIATLAAALSQAPEEIRRLRSELGRAGGLVKSFFVREDSSLLLADNFAKELAEALRIFVDTARATEQALEALTENLAPLRHELEVAVRGLAGR